MTNRRILIVEDDFELAREWTEVLEATHYDCDIAANTTEADTACRNVQYDAVIVDMFFKDRNGNVSSEGGLTFITRLRLPTLADTPRWGERVPIIAVTGSSGIVDARTHARNAGADRSFQKPIDPFILIDALTELVGQKG